MFNWIKDFIAALSGIEAFTRREYEKMDEERKRKGEVWHYTCNKGHKWKSYSSPTGSLCRDKYGMKETTCPKCGTTICRGEVYRNGAKTKMGAMHIGFKK